MWCTAWFSVQPPPSFSHSPPQIVVAVAAPPQGIHMDHAQFSGFAAPQRFFQPGNGISEPVLRDASHRDAVSALGFQHGVAFLQAGGHRLFHQHILSGVHGMDSDLRVGVRRGAHVHDINGEAGGQHFLMIVKHFAGKLVFFLHSLGFFRVNVAHGHNPAAVREGEQPFDMGRGDVACPHNRNVQHEINPPLP